jgi:hypothetical protein
MIEHEPLRYISSLLGVSFLAYVLNLSEEELQARIHGDVEQLDEPAEEALADVLRHAAELAGEPPVGEPPPLPEGSPAVRMRPLRA